MGKAAHQINSWNAATSNNKTNTQKLYIKYIFERFICAFVSNLFASLSEYAAISFFVKLWHFWISVSWGAAGGALNAASAVCGAEMQITMCFSNHQIVKYVVISVHFLLDFYLWISFQILINQLLF